jgi:WD40 repeat protein
LDIAVTSDNARFASVGGDRKVFLWDVVTGRTLRRWEGHSGRVNAVGFGAEGAVVVSGECGSLDEFFMRGERKRGRKGADICTPEDWG